MNVQGTIKVRSGFPEMADLEYCASTANRIESNFGN